MKTLLLLLISFCACAQNVVVEKGQYLIRDTTFISESRYQINVTVLDSAQAVQYIMEQRRAAQEARAVYEVEMEERNTQEQRWQALATTINKDADSIYQSRLTEQMRAEMQGPWTLRVDTNHYNVIVDNLQLIRRRDSAAIFDIRPVTKHHIVLVDKRGNEYNLKRRRGAYYMKTEQTTIVLRR